MSLQIEYAPQAEKRETLKGENSGSGVVAEGPKAEVIFSSWKLHSGWLHQKPDVTLFYPVNAEFNRDAEQQSASRFQCLWGILS